MKDKIQTLITIILSVVFFALALLPVKPSKAAVTTYVTDARHRQLSSSLTARIDNLSGIGAAGTVTGAIQTRKSDGALDASDYVTATGNTISVTTDGTASPSYIAARSGGTLDSPTKILSNATLFQIGGKGYTAAGWPSATNGLITLTAAEDFNGLSNTGTGWKFYITPSAGSTKELAAEMTSSKQLISYGTVQGTQLISTGNTGTAPLAVTSSTRVAHLNAETAGTADTLTTARTINGVSFNGSADINLTTGTTNNILFLAANNTITNDDDFKYLSANNYLGIGIGLTPTAKLHVSGSAESSTIKVDSSGYDSYLKLQRTSLVATGNVLGRAYFTGFDGTSQIDAAGILAVVDGTVATGAVPTEIRIRLRNAAGDFNDKVFFKSDGSIVLNSAVREYSGSKVLTDGSATGVFKVALPAGDMIGGCATYSVYATDGTDFQVHSGRINFAAVNKTGTYTTEVKDETVTDQANAKSSTATLTETGWTVTTGTNEITINANFDSSLTSPTITLKYKVTLHDDNVITPL